MDINLNDALTLKEALILCGSTLVIGGAFFSWIYAQFLRPAIDSADKRISKIEESCATQKGRDLPDRVGKLEERLREAELSIAVLKASEQERSTQLIRGLSELADAISQLKEDIYRGDIQSRIDSAEALVSSLKAAVTLAKLKSSESEAEAKNELNKAEEFLAGLRIEHRKASNGQENT